MTAFLFAFYVIGWLLLDYALVRLITAQVPPKSWRPLLRIALYVVLLPLPVIDEILAKSQFEQLCRESAAIKVDRDSAKGRTVYLAPVESVPAKGTWIPMTLRQWRFEDATTRQPVLSFTAVHASGGMFVRMLPLAEGKLPITFETASCQPAASISTTEMLQEFGLRQIQRSELGNQGAR